MNHEEMHLRHNEFKSLLKSGITAQVGTHPAHETQHLCDMFVQGLNNMQLYQQPTGVLMRAPCHQDGDVRLV